MEHKIGDKVRIKSGVFAGARAVIRALRSRGTVRLELEKGRFVSCDPKLLTNYSLAARKAWKSMPTRSVGRRVGSKRVDKLTVSFRIDRRLWEQFQEAETLGRVPSRNEIVTRCLEQVLGTANNGAR